MDTLLWVLVIFLFLNILVGLLRVLAGPTPEDRLAAAMLFGTTGVALLLVLAQLADQPSIRDVALVLVVLAAVVIVVFGEARRSEHGEHAAVEQDGGRDGSP